MNISLWCISMEVPGTTAALAERRLSSQELAQADRFHFRRDRTQFVLRRAARRCILGQCLERNPEAVEFTTTPNGKPAVRHPDLVMFSASNSGDMAILACAERGWTEPFGVDIEKCRSLSDGEGLARRHGSEHEYRTIMARPKAEREKLVLRYWTIKEAWLKATGEGVAGDLPGVQIRITSDEVAQVWTDEDGRIGQATLLERPEGYLIAIAPTCRTTRVVIHDFDWDRFVF